MTSDAQVIDVPGVPAFAIEPHHCFACGSLNTSGMGLELHVERGRSWVELTLEPRFQGWDGIAHGGILCTVLDEVMAWALVGEDDWGLTARLNVDFKRPVTVGQPIRAEGWITKSRRRIVETAGHVLDGRSGAVLATATGVYLAADEDRKAELRQRYGWTRLDGPQPATSERSGATGEARIAVTGEQRPTAATGERPTPTTVEARR